MRYIYSEGKKSSIFATKEELVKIIKDEDFVFATNSGNNNSYLLTYDNEVDKFELIATKGSDHSMSKFRRAFREIALCYKIRSFRDCDFLDLISSED